MEIGRWNKKMGDLNGARTLAVSAVVVEGGGGGGMTVYERKPWQKGADPKVKTQVSQVHV